MGEARRGKIALVSPPPPSPFAFVDYQYPLIGLAYLAAVLEKNGYSVMVLDCPAFKMTYSDIENALRLFKPDIVGITSVAATFASALQVARDIKESCSRALIVFGGPHATVMDKKIIGEHEEVDVVV
ncbi:MAG: cobalamin-dependent protein, partial [Candidatus Bathyarchaeota archaeon]|nr:cobalamin-dependent protein [Candidatus Bathyarchaeota archaeon]